MKALGIIILCGLTTLSTTASAEVFDVSGMQSWGLDGNANNDTRTFFPTQGAPLNVILAISFDITIETFGSSLLSDVVIRFGNSTGTFDGVWPDTFAPADGLNFSGTQRVAGSFNTDFHLNADGELLFSLFELVDNNPSSVDAVLLSGSSITVSYFIPTPSTGLLLAMGGLIATRRRR